ncbi:MAG: right-handed parallel beta-helix repeat-containing protein [Leptospiraceae bacterium]|nr:right-handed parallel beta-helix repeat-containing protein [Leptospiraceae bacterium]
MRSIFLFLFLFSQCTVELKKNYLPLYVTLILGNVGSAQNPSPSESASLVSTDFFSTETLAPILISKTRKLGVIMSGEMSKDCKLSFSEVVTESTVSLSDDLKTIYFTPLTTGWPVKLDSVHYIKFASCKDAKGNSVNSTGTGAPIYIADTVTYVDSKGSDSQDGKETTPVATITKGIEIASQGCAGACALAVKGGEYTLSTTLSIPANVSIFGGFDPSDWKKRRADKTTLSPYDTIINNTETNVSGTGTDPYGTIKYNTFTGTKEKSILDGLIVNGPSTATASSFVAAIAAKDIQVSSGITIRNTIALDKSTTASVTSAGFVSTNNLGAIVISNSKLNGSTTSAATSPRYGIVYSLFPAGASISVDSSDIDAGVSTQNSYGFFPTGATKTGTISLTNNTISGPSCTACNSVGVGIDATTASAVTLTSNSISGRTGTNTFGIEIITATSPTISKNTISSGTATALSTGIRVAGASASITENTISATSGTNSYGIEVTTGANHFIDKNIFTIGQGGSTTTHGINISGVATPITVSNNTMTVGTSASVGVLSGILKNANGVTITISGNTITVASCGSNCGNTRALSLGGGGGTGVSNVSNNVLNGGSSQVGETIYCNNDNTYSITGNTITGASCFNPTCSGTGIDVGFAATITISNNTITLSPCQGTSCSQKGIRMAAASVYTVTGNTIDTGPSSANTTARKGLEINNWVSGSSIQQNTIINQTGVGNPTAVDVVSAVANSLRFCSNVLIGGGRTDAGNAVTLSLAQMSGGARFNGNTITGGSVSSGLSYPVNLVSNAGYTGFQFDQNIIYGHPSSIASTTCMRENAASTYQTLVLNNFTNCSTLYNENGIIRNTLCTSGQVGNLSTGDATCGTGNMMAPTGLNNVSVATTFTNFAANDLHLTSGPTTLMAGADITVFNTACGNLLDRDGNTRSAGTAIGAYR